jgi:hypothetical protein
MVLDQVPTRACHLDSSDGTLLCRSSSGNSNSLWLGPPYREGTAGDHNIMYYKQSWSSNRLPILLD